MLLLVLLALLVFSFLLPTSPIRVGGPQCTGLRISAGEFCWYGHRASTDFVDVPVRGKDVPSVFTSNLMASVDSDVAGSTCVVFCGVVACGFTMAASAALRVAAKCSDSTIGRMTSTLLT